MNPEPFNWNAHGPIMAILRGVAPAEAASIGRVLLDAGIDLLEVPLNSPRPFDSIRALRDALSERATIGAGTVLHSDDVERAANAGAQFIVSPNTNPEIIGASLRSGLESVPGAMTPSEILTAANAGARMLKIFPAATLGPACMRDLSAILPDGLGLLAVGGINARNAREWLRAGACGVGAGSALYAPGDNPAQVAEKARELVQSVRVADAVTAVLPRHKAK